MSNIFSRAVSKDFVQFDKGYVTAESKEFSKVGAQSQAMGLSKSEGYDLYKENPLVFASKVENHENEHGKIDHPDMFDITAHGPEGNEKALADAFDNQEFASSPDSAETLGENVTEDDVISCTFSESTDFISACSGCGSLHSEDDMTNWQCDECAFDLPNRDGENFDDSSSSDESDESEEFSLTEFLEDESDYQDQIPY